MCRPPSRTAYLVEAANPASTYATSRFWIGVSTAYRHSFGGNAFYDDIHNGGSNLIFVDGHVQNKNKRFFYDVSSTWDLFDINGAND